MRVKLLSRHSCLLLVRYLLPLLIVALHVARPLAFGTEDVVIPVEDEEKRQETVYVTGSRPSGSFGSLVTFIQKGITYLLTHFGVKTYFAAFLRLQSSHSICRLSGTVAPPLLQGVM